ncbi:MAG: hypothetical protein HDR08_02785 [Lachnospiraceae bacterium]|nr:hypothetical protein [Lachnospiraceae bacterium]
MCIIAIRGKSYLVCAMKGDYGTKGTNEETVPKELVSFLRYVTDSTDVYIERTKEWKLGKIHERIRALKQSRELEERYMQFEELLKREYDEGYEQGYKTGYESGYRNGYKIGYENSCEEAAVQMLELISRMISDGKTDFIPRLKEETFYQEMRKEYHL